MEDQPHHTTTPKPAAAASSSSAPAPSSEPARSRWTPKPEQIVVLESIFNGGTVNPSKDETVRIRRLLEKFGPVGDANVFYWFQNRRSRSRRRQRQLLAAANAAATAPNSTTSSSGGGISFPYNYNNNNNTNNIISMMSGPSGCHLAPSSSSSSSSSPGCLLEFAPNNQALFSVAGDQSSDHNPNFAGPFPPNYSSSSGGRGIISVIVNGVETQIPAGSFDVKAVFGPDFILLHSTGLPVPLDDFGFCFHGLQHGEAYFLVPRVA